MKPCTVDGCGNKCYGRGLCRSHWDQQRPPCRFDGCSRPRKGRGYCAAHYAQLMRGKTPRPITRQFSTSGTCSVEGCGGPHVAQDLCSMHYRRSRKGTDLAAPPKTRRKSDRVMSRDAEGRKQCARCKRWLPESDYNPGKAADGRQSYCRDCHRYYTLKRRGMTVESFQALLESQGGKCGACGAPEPGGKRKQWHIDHDHSCCADYSCGKCVRGLLCVSCNLALGNVKDNPDTLRSLIDYLERTSIKAVAS